MMALPDYSSIPTDLPPRFQVRRLEEKHIPWAAAIVIHSNLFHSPVWPAVYPEVLSGHSFGVFDTEFQFKWPESGPEGQLHWDLVKPSTDETGTELLSQMDFPLCSVALAYDGFYPLDMEKLGPLVASLPAYTNVYNELDIRDQRKPESWKPTAPKQVLMRNATSSRHDIEGKAIMKKLAYFLMHYAHSLGFRGIQIECLHDKVTWVWTHPPAEYRSEVTASFNSADIEVEEEVEGEKTGKMTKPFGEAKQTATRAYVDLRPEGKSGDDGQIVMGPEGVGALG